MRLRPGEPLRVALAYAPNDVVRVGRLALDAGRTFFEYDAEYVRGGASFNPAWPDPDRTLVAARSGRAFEGLHPVFADGLPDAWGRELVRRRLAERGEDVDRLTALDRLALVGNTGPGALSYAPDRASRDDDRVNLDVLAHAASDLDGTPSEILEALAALGGSSGGARPKVLVARDAAGHTIAGTADVPDGYDPYIVKFRSRADVADVGPLEAAYADMARAAGIDVSPTTLIPERDRGPGYFATRRFDRAPGNARLHIISIAAIIEADWSEPAIDYAKLIAIVRNVTRSHAAAEQTFRRMVFNVLAANGDDHTKQHSLLQRRTGEWTLAPAYDLTLSSGPNGERYLAVNGRGRDIGIDDILAVAKESSIKASRARGIVDDVRAAIARFPTFAATYGVTRATRASFTRRRS